MSQTIAIVLNWRDATSTITCVQSLLALDQSLDVIVVDNDSGDGSLDAITEFCARAAPEHGYRLASAATIADNAAGRFVSVIGSGRNGGYAFGNNVGLLYALSVASCRYVWILNNDTMVPTASSLTALVAKMGAHPDIGLCGSTVAFAERPDTVQTLGGGIIDRFCRGGHYGKGQNVSQPVDEIAIERQLSYVNGAVTFVRRELLETVGLMTEDYFLYYEELDWAERAKGKFRLGYCASSLVYHVMGKTIGTHDDAQGSQLSIYYLTASKLKFCRRFYPLALPTVVFDMLLHIARDFRHKRGKRARAMLRAMVGLPLA